MPATLFRTADTVRLPSAIEPGGLTARLQSVFRQEFAVVDVEKGQFLRTSDDWLAGDLGHWLPLCELVARSGRAEVIEEHSPLQLLAVPIDQGELSTRVALTTLLVRSSPSVGEFRSAANVLRADAEALELWAAGREAWPAHAAATVANALIEAEAIGRTAAISKSQVSEMSGDLLAAFEELNLLYVLTEKLSLRESEHDFVEQAVKRLADVIPSDCIVAELHDKKLRASLVAGGECPIERRLFRPFFHRLGPQASQRTIVLNRNKTESPFWEYPDIREAVSSPIVAHGELIGWIAALNYRPKRGEDQGGFGTVEASLLSGVATLIGVHAANHDLLTQRADLFESAVQALTSAIDAKDHYTSGHSDRVARIAVRLAKELGCSADELNTVYLGGLLHDIGKIGVDDEVLRKPGKLSDAEYAQVKNHPVLGEQILKNVPQLEHVLPIVRHHHEAWDGSGYPDALVGRQCPLLARITAVADALDAMVSDRPYRKGMPLRRVETILRDGSGAQWDPRVIEAYQAAADDIAAICRVDREPLDLDVGRWKVGDACSIAYEAAGQMT